jgi:RimJ/RimL family protein N-acetyltransferase
VVDLSDPVFAIEIGGEACGGIGVRSEAGERRHGAELGYWVGHAHWGQGLMTRVVAAYAPWVMDQLSLLRLQATVLDINPASARVLLKKGFSEEGTMRGAAPTKPGLVRGVRETLRDPRQAR